MKKSRNKTLKEKGLLSEDIFTYKDIEEILSEMDNFFEDMEFPEFDLEEVTFDLEDILFE